MHIDVESRVQLFKVDNCQRKTSEGHPASSCLTKRNKLHHAYNASSILQCSCRESSVSPSVHTHTFVQCAD